MKEKKQKSYALEVTLIALALMVAFVVQNVIKSTNPPERPELLGDKHAATSDADGADKVGSGDADAVEKKEEIPREYVKSLSDLGSAPDWSKLDKYQFTINKEDFLRELEEVFTLNGDWKKWVEIEEDYALIRTSEDGKSEPYVLHFLTNERKEKTKRYWRAREEIKHSDAELPLEGLHVVIDPGHIGGNYAAMEGRKFKFHDSAPIEEGRLTMIVADLLEKQLSSLGAEVHLTRMSNAPVNPKRPKDYEAYALSKLKSTGAYIMKPQNKKEEKANQESIRKLSEELFYRAGEIKERAKMINGEFRPDVVVCLHFNANDWDENKLEQNEHVHLILNGAYMTGELAKDDERFAMMEKILQRVHPEELKISTSVAAAFAKYTGLPPYQYEPQSNRAVNVDGNPYLWARNLAANRSYKCPVVYCEPYLMNGVDSHARLQIGDYEGLGFVNGMLRPSIYREYVNAVTEGLVNYYKQRKISE